jgi:cation diffusion facilitator CzcD-associated flavoprotein CzcO
MTPTHPLTPLDVAVVGAGFGGMYMVKKARDDGLSVLAFEGGDDVGGTWYWNRYPGARCDVESLEYSFSFDETLQQEWQWTERYAAQPEILAYARHVADRFDLRRDIRFSTRVTSAAWDEATGHWTIVTDRGDTLRARFLVMATGPLSSTNLPGFEGITDFRGRTFHTGRWPHEPVDFTGRRVAVIGTGSSAVQMVPVVAPLAAQLTVFQRTAAYCVPARNGPIDPALEAKVKADYPGFRARNRQMMTAFGSLLPAGTESALEVSDAARERAFAERWAYGGFAFGRTFRDLSSDLRANEHAAQFIRDRIAEIVEDPEVAHRLMPTQPALCKRLCVDSGYYASFNRPNVRLIDLKQAPLERIVPDGIVAGGETLAFDDIVFATGFDAMTGSLLKVDPVGRDGLRLSQAWRDGPVNYLGLTVAGFPNLFTLVGPGSPSAFTNVIMQIEQHVEWVAGCIRWLRANDRSSIEATPDAQTAWTAHVNASAGQTVFSHCNSWYVGANVPGKPRMMMALLGFPPYVQRCEEAVRGGYTGFEVG